MECNTSISLYIHIFYIVKANPQFLDAQATEQHLMTQTKLYMLEVT